MEADEVRFDGLKMSVRRHIKFTSAVVQAPMSSCDVIIDREQGLRLEHGGIPSFSVPWRCMAEPELTPDGDASIGFTGGALAVVLRGPSDVLRAVTGALVTQLRHEVRSGPDVPPLETGALAEAVKALVPQRHGPSAAARHTLRDVSPRRYMSSSSEAAFAFSAGPTKQAAPPMTEFEFRLLVSTPKTALRLLADPLYN